MFLSAALIGIATWLVARQVSRDDKNALELLAAFVVGVVAFWIHFRRLEGLVEGVGSFLLLVGIGALLVAGYTARRRGPARPFFALGALLLVLAVVLFGSARFLSLRGTVELLVELGPDDRIEELAPVLERFVALAEQAFPNVTSDENEDLSQVFIVRVQRRHLEALSREMGLDTENVDHVEMNRAVTLDDPAGGGEGATASTEFLENDPLVPRQWALDAIHAHEAHQLLSDRQPARKARIAIVDTGIDQRHEDIRQAFSTSPGSSDPHGHGSHCAGIAGGVTNNGVGIASLNWESKFLEIRGYRALDAMGSGTIEQIAQAVIDAAEDGADVISMSLGDRSPTAPKTLSDAIGYARSRGAIVLVSAGNSNEDAANHMPSNVEGVIVVSALDPSLRKASFSNTNTSLARPIAAPGVDILSLKPGGGYVSMSGTSMSTPMVAGLVGIMRSLRPDIDESEVYDILTRTSGDVPDARRTGRIVNAGAAVQATLDSAGS